MFLYTLGMKTLSDTEFREQCLCLLDHVPSDGVLITKGGQPIARLVPIARSCINLIGSVEDITVDPEDTLFSTGMTWDAQS